MLPRDFGIHSPLFVWGRTLEIQESELTYPDKFEAHSLRSLQFWAFHGIFWHFPFWSTLKVIWLKRRKQTEQRGWWQLQWKERREGLRDGRIKHERLTNKAYGRHTSWKEGGLSGPRLPKQGVPSWWYHPIWFHCWCRSLLLSRSWRHWSVGLCKGSVRCTHPLTR